MTTSFSRSVVLALLPYIEQAAKRFSKRSEENLLDSFQSSLAEFVEELLSLAELDRLDLKLERGLTKLEPRFPWLRRCAEDQKGLSKEDLAAVPDFLLAWFLEARPENRTDWVDDASPVSASDLASDVRAERTAELLRETITDALAEQPAGDGPPNTMLESLRLARVARESRQNPERTKTAVGSAEKSDQPSGQQSSLQSGQPSGQRKAPPIRRNADDFTAQLVQRKKNQATSKASKGFSTQHSRFETLQNFLVDFLDAPRQVLVAKNYSRAAARRIILGILILGFGGAAYGAAKYFIPPPPAPAPTRPRDKWRVSPEVVLPTRNNQIEGPIFTLHGFGQRGKIVEVSVDGAIVGSAETDKDWVWQVGLANPLEAGAHRVEVRYTISPGATVDQTSPISAVREFVVVRHEPAVVESLGTGFPAASKLLGSLSSAAEEAPPGSNPNPAP